MANKRRNRNIDKARKKEGTLFVRVFSLKNFEKVMGRSSIWTEGMDMVRVSEGRIFGTCYVCEHDVWTELVHYSKVKKLGDK